MAKILVCWGTRPEAIKLRPVVDALRRHEGVEVRVWESMQSKDLVEGYEGEKAKVHWSSLTFGIADCMTLFQLHMASWRPDVVVVQGDTATAFACALTSFLEGIPVAHVEAGLRTYSAEPWPEEALRRIITPLAKWHFCPDNNAFFNLLRETRPELEDDKKTIIAGNHLTRRIDDIFIVGNPVIDTLPRKPFKVLATLHRRENWGPRIKAALGQLNDFAEANEAIVDCVVHPNWEQHAIGLTLEEVYNSWPHLFFYAPLPRERLLEFIEDSDVVVTDSGGLQEEAAHFGKPCLVIRTATERTALLRLGAVELVDPDNPGSLTTALDRLLLRRCAYGVGNAGEKIAEILVRELSADDD